MDEVLTGHRDCILGWLRVVFQIFARIRMLLCSRIQPHKS